MDSRSDIVRKEQFCKGCEDGAAGRGLRVSGGPSTQHAPPRAPEEGELMPGTQLMGWTKDS